MGDTSGVLVLGDVASGELSSTSMELLAAGRGIADGLGEELAIGLFSDTLDVAAPQAISRGADKVYAVTHPLLSDYQVDLQLAAMVALAREANPNVILLGRTNQGRELAPQVGLPAGRRVGPGLSGGLGRRRNQETSLQPAGVRRKRGGRGNL